MSEASQMEQQDASPAVKYFESRRVKQPHCPIHYIKVSQIPKTDEGLKEHAKLLLKCEICMLNLNFARSQFQGIEDLLIQYANEFDQIRKQSINSKFTSKLEGWVDQLDVPRKEVESITERILKCIKLCIDGQLLPKLENYLHACIKTRTPEQNQLAASLLRLKQHLLVTESGTQLVENSIKLTEVVSLQDPALGQIIKEMQAKSKGFLNELTIQELVDYNSQRQNEAEQMESQLSNISLNQRGVKDFQIDMADTIKDAPESIVAYQFNCEALTFNQLTVADLGEGENPKYKSISLSINHPEHLPTAQFSPITYDNRVFIIGGYVQTDSASASNTCQELDLQSAQLIRRKEMNNRRSVFGGAVMQERYIQVVAGECNLVNIQKCERYDIISDSWEEIADYPSDQRCSTCCRFNEKQIQGFGVNTRTGEQYNEVCMYSMEDNSWTQINIQADYKLLITGDICNCAVQINSKQIQLLGGHQFGQRSCLYEVDLDQPTKMRIKRKQGVQLDYPQTHITQRNQVIYKEKLYCSQVIQNISGNYVSYFDSKKWKAMIK